MLLTETLLSSVTTAPDSLELSAACSEGPGITSAGISGLSAMSLYVSKSLDPAAAPSSSLYVSSCRKSPCWGYSSSLGGSKVVVDNGAGMGGGWSRCRGLGTV